jgi:LPXTG-motif cell wall-anchored protein
MPYMIGAGIGLVALIAGLILLFRHRKQRAGG